MSLLNSYGTSTGGHAVGSVFPPKERSRIFKPIAKSASSVTDPLSVLKQYGGTSVSSPPKSISSSSEEPRSLASSLTKQLQQSSLTTQLQQASLTMQPQQSSLTKQPQQSSLPSRKRSLSEDPKPLPPSLHRPSTEELQFRVDVAVSQRSTEMMQQQMDTDAEIPLILATHER